MSTSLLEATLKGRHFTWFLIYFHLILIFASQRYTASQSDVVLFSALKSAPAASLPHALRWYNHLKSFGDGKSKLPGVKKALSDFGATGGAAPAAGKAAAAADDDDDVDLFGSDDEVDEAAEKLKQDRLAAYAAKKSKSKCPTI